MSTERSFWKNVVKPGLERPGMHLIRVENPALPGTPDVNGCFQGHEFWVELKALTHWPRIDDSKPILIPHFTQQQRVWLRKRWMSGGSAWLLVRIDGPQREHLLFDGGSAWDIGVSAPRRSLYRLASLAMGETFDPEAVLSKLMKE